MLPLWAILFMGKGAAGSIFMPRVFHSGIRQPDKSSVCKRKHPFNKCFCLLAISIRISKAHTIINCIFTKHTFIILRL